MRLVKAGGTRSNDLLRTSVTTHNSARHLNLFRERTHYNLTVVSVQEQSKLNKTLDNQCEGDNDAALSYKLDGSYKPADLSLRRLSHVTVTVVTASCNINTELLNTMRFGLNRT